MTIARPPIGRWLSLQLAMVLGISALFLFRSPLSAQSALLGGMIFLVPHSYFAFKAFSTSGARAANRMVNAMLFGETVKLILTALFFAAVFMAVEPIDVVALLFTYAVMVVSQWLAPLALKSSSLR